MGKYFGLSDDWDELTGSYRSGGDRAVAGLKLLGKGLFNVGKFAVTEVVPGAISEAGKRTEAHLEKNRENMSSDQIARAEEFTTSAQHVRERHERVRDVDEKIRRLEDDLNELPEDSLERVELTGRIETLRESRPSSAFKD